MKRIKISTSLFNYYFSFDLSNENKSNNNYLDIILLDFNDNQFFIGEISKNKFHIDIHENKYYQTVKEKFNPARYRRLYSINENDYPFILLPEALYNQKNITKEVEIEFFKSQQQRLQTKRIEDLISKIIYRDLKFSENLLVDSQSLNQNDLSLINLWKNTSNSKVIIKNLSEIKMDAYDLGRLVSARKAEIASVRYLKNFQQDVKDISICQTNNTDTEWKFYDIAADNIFYDVKNSRHSQMNNDTYTKHEIPSFKVARTGNQVKILSVLSDYVPKFKEEEYKQTKHKILGVTSKAEINKLVNFINKKFNSLLDLTTLTTTRFFPGWIFDYPSNFYEKKNIFIKYPEDFDINKLPTWCSVYLFEAGYNLDKKLSSDQIEIIQDIIELKASNNFTRPFLFYYVLGQLLNVVTNKEEYEKKSSFLKNLLFRDFKKTYYTKRPLGIYDPLEYVKNLISIFDQHRYAIAQENFESYKLTHPQILCGQKGETFLTIIAYCGGWIRNEKPCGHAPLVIGENKRCQRCKKLICDECNHCSHECPHKLDRYHANNERQFEKDVESNHAHS